MGGKAHKEPSSYMASSVAWTPPLSITLLVYDAHSTSSAAQLLAPAETSQKTMVVAEDVSYRSYPSSSNLWLTHTWPAHPWSQRP